MCERPWCAQLEQTRWVASWRLSLWDGDGVEMYYMIRSAIWVQTYNTCIIKFNFQVTGGDVFFLTGGNVLCVFIYVSFVFNAACRTLHACHLVFNDLKMSVAAFTFHFSQNSSNISEVSIKYKCALLVIPARHLRKISSRNSICRKWRKEGGL